MADNTKIEWADATANFWIGCTKLSPACDHCYAERDWDHRKHRVTWGPHGDRSPVKAGADVCRKIRNGAAAFLAEHGRKPRIFVNSLSDFADNHKSIRPEWREAVWEEARNSPDVTFMILTKRPQNLPDYLPADWGAGYPNVWLGTTVENQEEADRRIPHLLATPAVRFLSCEPLLGPVDIGPWIRTCYECGASCGLRLSQMPEVERCTECGEECGPETEPVLSEGCPKCCGELEPVCPDCGHYMVHQHPDTPNIDWIIAGGESGPGARPSHPDWFRSLRDQCAAAGVPFFMKQLSSGGSKPIKDIEQFPKELRLRQFPQ